MHCRLWGERDEGDLVWMHSKMFVARPPYNFSWRLPRFKDRDSSSPFKRAPRRGEGIFHSTERNNRSAYLMESQASRLQRVKERGEGGISEIKFPLEFNSPDNRCDAFPGRCFSIQEHREIEYYLPHRLKFTNNETMNAIQAGKLISQLILRLHSSRISRLRRYLCIISVRERTSRDVVPHFASLWQKRCRWNRPARLWQTSSIIL